MEAIPKPIHYLSAPATMPMTATSWKQVVDGHPLDGYGKPVREWAARSVHDTFFGQYSYEACIPAYSIKLSDGSYRASSPRLSSRLHHYLVRHHFGDPVGRLLYVDYDLPEKRWTYEAMEQWPEWFSAWEQRGDLLARPSIFYTTRKGWRLIWWLSDDVPLLGLGCLDHLQALLLAYAYRRGIKADKECLGWSRLIRLPAITREGEGLWHLQTFRQSIGCVRFDGSASQSDSLLTFSPNKLFKFLTMELRHAA